MSDDFMKSALDRAMERADQIEIPEEKLREMEYRAQGERLAAGFFKKDDYDLEAALAECNSEARQYIAKALEAVLLQNVVLPKKESDMSTNEKVFNGLSSIKKNKKVIQQAKEQLDNLSNYYTQARKQHYDQLKAQVEQVVAQQIRQQTGMAPGGDFNVEQRPEFQENWRQLSAQLDSEYDNALAQLKAQITAVP